MVAAVASAPAKHFRPARRLVGNCPGGGCTSSPSSQAGNFLVAAGILRQAAAELAVSVELPLSQTQRLHALASRLGDRTGPGCTNQDALAASPTVLGRSGVHVALVELIAAAVTVVDLSQPPSRRRAALVNEAKRLLRLLEWRFPDVAAG